MTDTINRTELSDYIDGLYVRMYANIPNPTTIRWMDIRIGENTDNDLLGLLKSEYKERFDWINAYANEVENDLFFEKICYFQTNGEIAYLNNDELELDDVVNVITEDGKLTQTYFTV